MAFRKRNIPINRPAASVGNENSAGELPPPGVRPSPLTSHSVTSTGTQSLDDILGGHSGLALGSSLLIEESGTTDFAGALLRFYAAEGICQGHVVHVVGVGDEWARSLPGVAEDRSTRSGSKAAEVDEEKMRIAWRYERLGQAGKKVLSDRSHAESASPSEAQRPFCHSFDLTKRMSLPSDAKLNLIPITPASRPFQSIIQALTQSLRVSAPNSVHRLVIPTILSPALYTPHTSQPENFLQFLHSLRSLLHQYPTKLTAMITLPLELYPRSSGLVRWAEILCDGVMQLTPFPHLMDASNSASDASSTKGGDEQPQGMLRVHKLPIATERGEGGAGAGNSIGDDLAFTVSRRKFMIKPFSLPPLEGDQDAQKEGGGVSGKAVEF